MLQHRWSTDRFTASIEQWSWLFPPSAITKIDNEVLFLFECYIFNKFAFIYNVRNFPVDTDKCCLKYMISF